MARESNASSVGIDIGISADNRKAIADGLSRLLADTYTLYLTTHNFHWNVTGPMFNTLHAMFMAQYTELWNAVDPIAERIRSLGHAAPGSYAQFGALVDRRRAGHTAEGDGDGSNPRRWPRSGGAHRTREFSARRPSRRPADRRPADPALDGA